MSGSDVTQLAADFIDAFNRADWPRFQAHMAPEVVYQETGTLRRVQGHERYVELCQGWKQALPDVTGTIERSIASGSTVAQELTWRGTHTGPLLGPGGTLPATGKRVQVQASFWLTFQGGRVTEAHHHLDVLSLLQQLGMLPTPEQAAG